MLSEHFFKNPLVQQKKYLRSQVIGLSVLNNLELKAIFLVAKKGLKYILTSRYHVLRVIKVEPMLGFSLLPWQQIENRLPVEDTFCLFTLPARVRLQYIKFLNPDWPDLLLFNRCCAFLTDKFEFYV